MLFWILGNPFIFLLTFKLSNASGKNQVYIVNYHDTPRKHNLNFGKQIEFIRKHFQIIGLSDVESHINSTERKKPGFVFTFDDGLRSNYVAASEVLKKYSIPATFLVPVKPCDEPHEENINSESQRLAGYKINAEADSCDDSEPSRLSMNWNEVKLLQAQGHTIGCHGYEHIRLSSSLSQEQFETEIQQSRMELEARLESKIDVFCWIGGELNSYCKTAADLIRKSSYKIGLMTCCQPVNINTGLLNWHRYNIESDFSLHQVRMILGGGYTLMYRKKSGVVDNITSA